MYIAQVINICNSSYMSIALVFVYLAIPSVVNYFRKMLHLRSLTGFYALQSSFSMQFPNIDLVNTAAIVVVSCNT